MNVSIHLITVTIVPNPANIKLIVTRDKVLNRLEKDIQLLGEETLSFIFLDLKLANRTLFLLLRYRLLFGCNIKLFAVAGSRWFSYNVL